MLIFLGYKFLECLAFITPYPISYFIAGIVARLAYLLGIYVPVLKKNVANALKKDIRSPDVAKIVRKVYINWFLNVTDFLKHPLVSKEKFKKRIRLEGLKNLDNALKLGKGAVIFTTHLGNFEWGACRIGVQGYRIWGTGLIRKYKRTNEFFEKRRLSKGLNTLYANRVMINIFRILKNNEIIAIPADFDSLGTANTYKFFGKMAHIPSGPVEIAMKSGAPLLPSFTWRIDKYNHFQVIGKPVALINDNGNKEKRKEIIRLNMELMIAVIEKYISEHIEHWELFHDIWAN
jgi:lauroyl/myristoyl acyltransferase